MYESKQERLKREAERKARMFTTTGSKPQSLKEYRKEYDEQQIEIAQRPVKAAVAKRVENERDLTRFIKKFYGADLETMGLSPVDDAPVDFIMGLNPTRIGPRNLQSEGKVYWQFRNALALEHGTTMTEEGWIRLGSWVAALSEYGIEPTVEVWEEGLHRLKSLDCFDPSELHDYLHPAQPV